MGIKHLGAGFMHGRVNLGPKITIDSSIRLSIACAGICFKYMYASSLLAGRTGLVNSSKSHIPIAHHYSTGLCKSITCVTMNKRHDTNKPPNTTGNRNFLADE